MAGQPRDRLRRWGRAKLVESIGSRLYPMARRYRLQDRLAVLNQGGLVMDRAGGSVFRGSLRFLLIAACTSYAAVSPVRAVEPGTTAPAAQLADGIWIVQGRAIPGSRHCGDRLVRLTNRQGRLSGVVALARASVPIQNLALLPDGSFSGATRAGLTGSRLARFYNVTGKFSGDTVSLTLEDHMCPPRRGEATRHAAAG
jgi:hypothetical protein